MDKSKIKLNDNMSLREHYLGQLLANPNVVNASQGKSNITQAIRLVDYALTELGK